MRSLLLLVSLAFAAPAPVLAASKEGCGGECKCAPPRPAPKRPRKDPLRPDFKIGPGDLPKPAASVVALEEVRHA